MIVTEEREIIDIPDIFLCTDPFLDEMIEAVEIDVGEELAGQISDRQSAAAFHRREQIVSVKVCLNLLLGIAGIDDRLDQPERFPTLDLSTDDGFQDFVIDAREVFSDVALQNIPARSREFREAA